MYPVVHSISNSQGTIPYHRAARAALLRQTDQSLDRSNSSVTLAAPCVSRFSRLCHIAYKFLLTGIPLLISFSESIRTECTALEISSVDVNRPAKLPEELYVHRKDRRCVPRRCTMWASREIRTLTATRSTASTPVMLQPSPPPENEKLLTTIRVSIQGLNWGDPAGSPFPNSDLRCLTSSLRSHYLNWQILLYR